MFDMRNIIIGHARQSLSIPVVNPSPTLAVGEDETHTNIPLLLFTEQHLPTVKPEVLPDSKLSFEDVQLDGTGASLALEDFETQNFNIGNPYGN